MHAALHSITKFMQPSTVPTASIIEQEICSSAVFCRHLRDLHAQQQTTAQAHLRSSPLCAPQLPAQPQRSIRCPDPPPSEAACALTRTELCNENLCDQ